MMPEKLFELAALHLKKNDFGIAHTRRVFEIAKEHFDIPESIEEITLARIMLAERRIPSNKVEREYCI